MSKDMTDKSKCYVDKSKVIEIIEGEFNFHIGYGKSTPESRMRFHDIVKRINKLRGKK